MTVGCENRLNHRAQDKKPSLHGDGDYGGLGPPLVKDDWLEPLWTSQPSRLLHADI